MFANTYYLLRTLLLTIFSLSIIHLNVFTVLDLIYQFPILVDINDKYYMIYQFPILIGISDKYYMIYLTVISSVCMIYLNYNNTFPNGLIIISGLFIMGAIVLSLNTLDAIINLNQYSDLQLMFNDGNYLMLILGIFMTTVESIAVLFFTKPNEQLK